MWTAIETAAELSQLAIYVARVDSEQWVVFISGGTFTPELDDFLRTTANRCLPKPFKLDEVFKAIDATCADRGTAL